MARYIKANPLVARYLQLDNERDTVSDGNYLFWQADMLKFGPLTQLNDILVKIGGLALSPHEAREEQDGTVCRQLPMATDARFQRPIKGNVNDAIVTPSVGEEEQEQPSAETDADNSNEGQTPTDDTAEEASEDDAEADPNQKESEQSELETNK